MWFWWLCDWRIWTMLEKMNMVNVGVWSVFENDAAMYQ